jgi:hypothetical protein
MLSYAVVILKRLDISSKHCDFAKFQKLVNSALQCDLKELTGETLIAVDHDVVLLCRGAVIVPTLAVSRPGVTRHVHVTKVAVCKNNVFHFFNNSNLTYIQSQLKCAKTDFPCHKHFLITEKKIRNSFCDLITSRYSQLSRCNVLIY